ncbi:rrna-processing protein fcf2 [Mycoemilia scoparia]|uniref:Rrna-processing protein fcf2 n=1 Tax=Mycoemilia scoparia TaxID=417184 RepID=A0A9W8DX29_9FUNG|nr:rrna-processing protein fcf2 [Mycoemilia scoparia]
MPEQSKKTTKGQAGCNSDSQKDVDTQINTPNNKPDLALLLKKAKETLAKEQAEKLVKSESDITGVQISSKKSMVEELMSKKSDPLEPKTTRGERKKKQQETAGAAWFGMKAPIVTPELKRDLRVLKLRNALDPKRFYRKEDRDEVPKYFEVGTIVEGPTEFYSGRLTRKERKETIVQELMADAESRDYFKRKFNEIQSKKASGGKQWYRQMVGKRQRK